MQSRKDQSNLHRIFAQKKFKDALGYLEESELNKDKKHKLLYLMEKGTVTFYQGEFKESGKIFVKANELVDKLYTKSIKEKLVSSVLNDNSETFYASMYERSLLYYYQAMSFYHLYQSGSYKETVRSKDEKLVTKIVKLTDVERSRFKQSTRSTLIAWDSFFQEMKRMSGNKSILKEDLVSKLMAAKLHILLGKKRDKEVALQLFKDARKILINIGPTQKIFNSKFKEYNKQVKDYYNKDLKKSELNKKNLTEHYQLTLNYIDLNILKIIKSQKSYALKKTIRSLKPKKSVLKELKLNNKNNVELIIEIGHISSLTGKDFSFNLNSALSNIDDPSTKTLVESIGVPVLTYFAMGPLGLGYVSNHGNLSIYSQHRAGEYVTKEVGVEFEMPYVEENDQSAHYVLKIMSKKEMIASKELKILSSLDANAFIHSQEMIESSFDTRSLRIGVKYAFAIAAAFGTYNSIKKSSGDLFARPAALTQFLISSKGIKETEKADVRHWSTLPSKFTTESFNLPVGSYEVVVEEYKSKALTELSKRVTVGQLEVSSQEPALFSYRLF
jgi:hypothetical protein